MTKVHCSVDERNVDPLFEVFDGGDFILSSYHDVEETTSEIQIFFPDASRTEDAKRALASALAVLGLDAPIEVSEIPDEDWRFSYRRHFKTERVSPRIFTHPPWEPMPETANGEIVLTLDPGLAFGTGKHETTKACLKYIDEIASASSPARLSFLDMGTGSGILSIAAAKLGFKSVAGFDMDEVAVAAARENAAENGVSADLRVFALGAGAKERVFEPADVVVANILGPLLIDFADEISSYAKGTLVVSGILNELYPDVLSAFAARGFREVSRKTLGAWTTGRLNLVWTNSAPVCYNSNCSPTTLS